jgi:hypothetical protein
VENCLHPIIIKFHRAAPQLTGGDIHIFSGFFVPDVFQTLGQPLVKNAMEPGKKNRTGNIDRWLIP